MLNIITQGAEHIYLACGPTDFRKQIEGLAALVSLRYHLNPIPLPVWFWSVTVHVDVTNTGSLTGKAVVQLYVQNAESTVRRPIRELRSFDKVTLQPGETKTLSFSLNKRAFAYYEPKIHDFFVESGEFMIEIGDSCRDIRLCQPITVEGTTLIPFTVTKTSTIGQLMKHPKGAAFIQKMISSSKGPSDAEQAAAMGEGSEKIMQSMMFEMPLGALVSYGRMTASQLEALIASLNEWLFQKHTPIE